ncbi:MAG: tail fiber domain-containing protein [Bacteroidia bacterium]
MQNFNLLSARFAPNRLFSQFLIGLGALSLFSECSFAQNVGIGTATPAAKLDVAAPGNWNTAASEGDVRIGNASYRLKIGVALGGGGAGDVRVTASGGTNRLFLGGGTNTNVAVIDGTGQRVGINTYDPNTTLDVWGDLALKTTAATLTGAAPNYAVNTTTTPRSYYRISTPTANFNVTSMTVAPAAGISSSDGRIVTLYNATNFNMTINNQDGTATAAERIITGNGSNLVIGANGSVTFVYNTTDARWVVKDYNNGVGGGDWKLDGNMNGAQRSIGTNDNFDFPMETNGTEKARLTAGGVFAVGNTTMGMNANITGYDKLGTFSSGTGYITTHSVQDATWSDYFVNTKSRGTGAAPTMVADGDFVGGIWGNAYDGTTYQWMTAIITQVDGTPGVNDMPGRLLFATSPDGSNYPVERMRITSAGNVGIGTSAPTLAILQQHGVVGNTSAIFGGNLNGISLVSSWPGIYFNAYYSGGTRALQTGYTGNISLDPIGGRYIFNTGATAATGVLAAQTERMTILNNGNVGINTFAPTALLEVNGSVIINEFASNSDVRMESQTRPYMFWLDADQNAVRYGSSAGTLSSNGSVINGVTVDYLVDFDKGTADGAAVGIGSVEFLLDGISETHINNDFTPTVNITYDLGFTYAWDDVYADDFWNVSDIRAKKEVKDMSYGLAELMKMRTISYKLKEDPFQETKLGLVAQEVLALTPELVKTHDYKATDENEPNKLNRVALENMRVNYVSMVPVLIKAIQEQQAMIETLEKKVAVLEGKTPTERIYSPVNQNIKVDKLKQSPESIMINIGNPQRKTVSTDGFMHTEASGTPFTPNMSTIAPSNTTPLDRNALQKQ